MRLLVARFDSFGFASALAVGACCGGGVPAILAHGLAGVSMTVCPMASRWLRWTLAGG